MLPYFPYELGVCPHGGPTGGHCVQNDTEIFDYHLLQKTQQYLAFAADNTRRTGQPFFLMAGFKKPHAPWQAPQRMYDLYAPRSAIRTATNDTFPPSSPLIAWSHQLDVMLANGTTFPYTPFQPVPPWVQQDQRQAYYAAVSYVDEHVGALLAQLNASGLANNTIVVVHSDHGYLLGEHGLWEKKSNFEDAVRVPLLLHVPSKPASHGRTTESLTELVDVMPTLLSLANVVPPAVLDGKDLSPLLDDPTQSLKPAAFHQYPACNVSTFNATRADCNLVPQSAFDFMGFSIRTSAWRYTAWFPWNHTTSAADFAGPYAPELYPHAGDNGTNMDAYENTNMAVTFPAVAASLHAQLLAFFTSDK